MPTDIELLPAIDEARIHFLDTIMLDGNKRLLPLTSHFYRKYISRDELRVWCHHRARYNLATRELIDWLRQRIDMRKTIEIGAGMGDLGYHLGIPMTDSYQQVEHGPTKKYMELTKQVGTTPPLDVMKCDAQTAVLRFKPQVVIGAWITQRWLPGGNTGNECGPREDHILKNCETYIHIGNENVHGDKRILSLPHETYRFPWLVSRAKDQLRNCIYLWNRK